MTDLEKRIGRQKTTPGISYDATHNCTTHKPSLTIISIHNVVVALYVKILYLYNVLLMTDSQTGTAAAERLLSCTLPA